MRLRRLVRFGKLVCIHIETNLEITRVSPPHLVVPGQAQNGLIRFVHTAIYSVLCRAVPGLEGSVNGVLNSHIYTHIYTMVKLYIKVPTGIYLH